MIPNGKIEGGQNLGSKCTPFALFAGLCKDKKNRAKNTEVGSRPNFQKDGSGASPTNVKAPLLDAQGHETEPFSISMSLPP
jgi:hypothetical protein